MNIKIGTSKLYKQVVFRDIYMWTLEESISSLACVNKL